MTSIISLCPSFEWNHKLSIIEEFIDCYEFKLIPYHLILIHAALCLSQFKYRVSILILKLPIELNCSYSLYLGNSDSFLLAAASFFPGIFMSMPAAFSKR